MKIMILGTMNLNSCASYVFFLAFDIVTVSALMPDFKIIRAEKISDPFHFLANRRIRKKQFFFQFLQAHQVLREKTLNDIHPSFHRLDRILVIEPLHNCNFFSKQSEFFRIKNFDDISFCLQSPDDGDLFFLHLRR